MPYQELYIFSGWRTGNGLYWLFSSALLSRASARRNSESLAWGRWTCCVVIDKRALLLHEATLSLKGAYASCYMTWSCDRKLYMKLLEIMNKIFFFLNLSKCIILVGPHHAPQREINTCAAGWWRKWGQSGDKVANKGTQVLLLRDVKSKNANENKCAHTM